MSSIYEPKTDLGRAIHALEVNFIALSLGLMTLFTFINVVLRYVFNTGIIWSLEFVLVLFAWLVILGVSHAIKINAHLGVDAVTNLLPPNGRRACAVISGICTVIFALLLLKGAWDYWANFANLPQTTGRWLPTGFEEMKRSSYRSWYELNDIPMPGFMQFLADWMNEGERYEKIPRFIPYAMLPIGMAILLFRCVEALIAIWHGTRESLIVSHEAEDAVDAAAREAK